MFNASYLLIYLIYKCKYVSKIKLFFKNHSCEFVLLEKKNYETYLETINQIRCILHNKYNVVLAHKVLILDFELAMQQALRQGFLGNCEIKGCWFHFCQAILRQLC